jgi:hypothetical protein
LARRALQQYADDNSLFFLETSAKTAMNVNELFLAIGTRPDRTPESTRSRIDRMLAPSLTVSMNSGHSHGHCTTATHCLLAEPRCVSHAHVHPSHLTAKRLPKSEQGRSDGRGTVNLNRGAEPEAQAAKSGCC